MAKSNLHLVGVFLQDMNSKSAFLSHGLKNQDPEYQPPNQKSMFYHNTLELTKKVFIY